MQFNILPSSNNKVQDGVTNSSGKRNPNQVTWLSYLIIDLKFLKEILVPVG
jgi:hypothetical protein